MATTLAQKLKIKDNFSLLIINAPADFNKRLGNLPSGVKISNSAKGFDQIHWFVMNQSEMEKNLDKTLQLLKPNIILWIYYPKGTSKLQTDLTRDKGWDALLKHTELTWISLISFDDTWSAFGCRLQTEADQKKKEKIVERPILDYIDAAKKTVRLPEDLQQAFRKNRKQELFFNGLSFTNKKEYVEWILNAKREETRINRIKGTLERLEKGWKNPNNN